MKTLKNYISTDLKSLETSLTEASLLDIEGTIEGGEKAIKDKIERYGKLAEISLEKLQNYLG